MRDQRLDYAKGIAILLVLGSHLMPLTVVAAASRPLQLLNAGVLSYHYFLSTLGVPLFYLVMATLFFRKPDPRRRLTRIVVLFAFWVGVQYAVWALSNRQVPPFGLSTLRLGGPSLVGARATVFYFLVDAFALMLGAAGLVLLEKRSPRVALLLAWAGVIGSGVAFWAMLLARYQLPLWAVCNFWPYVGLPYLFSRGLRIPHWTHLAFAAVLSAILEGAACWCLNGAVFTLPNNARTSTLFGALAVFSLCIAARRLVFAAPVALVGRYSLGVYAVHTFVQYGLGFVLPPLTVAVGGGRVDVTLALTLATLAGTAVLVLLLGRTPLRRFVS